MFHFPCYVHSLVNSWERHPLLCVHFSVVPVHLLDIRWLGDVVSGRTISGRTRLSCHCCRLFAGIHPGSSILYVWHTPVETLVVRGGGGVVVIAVVCPRMHLGVWVHACLWDHTRHGALLGAVPGTPRRATWLAAHTARAAVVPARAGRPSCPLRCGQADANCALAQHLAAHFRHRAVPLSVAGESYEAVALGSTRHGVSHHARGPDCGVVGAEEFL
mmetsp:Transcript_14492/g.36677  ORF Transcript_14492/g.36677 Transcript_14492/m.36677 type:complete len:217 (-) Transcript_14492:1045-1695(-)